MTNSSKSVRLCAAVFIPLVIYFLPIPTGLTEQAWLLFSIFLGTIILIISGAFPMGAASLMGLTTALLTGAMSFTVAFAGFTSQITWLILCAFFISFGLVHTGLGKRIAYMFIATFGKSSLGLAYGIGLSELILAPGTPSSTARTGGIIYPVVESISRTFDSLPNHPSSKKIGSYLLLCLFHFSVITSTMFMTSMAANPFAAKLVQGLQIQLTWGSWALYGLVPGLVSLLFVPVILDKIAPPEIRDTSGAVIHAKQELAKLGHMKQAERLMAVGFVILMGLWVSGPLIGVSSVLAALIGVIFLLITNVVSWEQLIKLHNAFETFIWFGALLALAEALSDSGFTKWFGQLMANQMSSLPTSIGVALLIITYFYSHYFFASCTAHVGAMLLPMLSGAIALGAPALPTTLAFCYAGALYSSLTHYGNGQAPVLFGAGFVSLKEWWKAGFIMSLVNILTWVVVGYFWWQLLGLL